MNELNSLKTLLLKEEQEELELLKKKIKELDMSISTPKMIVDKISPHLSSIIHNSSINDEKILSEALSPIVFDLIDKSYVQSKTKITKQLAPLITAAIKEQIKSQKDEVVEALYPVLGNMISKYVTKTFEEMINKINSQLTSGLSFKSFSRKIEAKVKGVSESELLLSENTSANIRSVFLIHKETGIVLSHVEHEDNPINEPEMVASMMTAIRSFVNDWVEQNEQYNELGTIEYGGSKIIIEASGFSYLAVIVDGVVDGKTNKKIRNVLESIVSSFSDEIKNFNGDLSTLSCDMYYKKISILIEDENEEILKSKKHPLLYLLPIALLSWLGWLGYLDYKNNETLENINQKIHQIKNVKVYKLSSSLEDGVLTLDGFIRNENTNILINDNISNINGVNSIINNIIILDEIIVKAEEPKQVEIIEKEVLLRPEISFLINTLNISESRNLHIEEKNDELILTGSVWSKKDKVYIFTQLKDFGNIKVRDNIKIIFPQIDTKIYFGKNVVSIPSNEEYKLIKMINLLEKLDSTLTLEVKGYSDNIGLDKRNIVLANKRAKEVVKYLKDKGIISQVIKVKEFVKEDIKTSPGRYVLFSLNKEVK